MPRSIRPSSRPRHHGGHAALWQARRLIRPKDRVAGGTFGLATVLGPLIGGFFVEHLTWRWIFYVNLPLGLIAVTVIGLAFTAPNARRRPKVDVAGAVLLAVTLTALILLASLGGHSLAWKSPETIGLVAVTIAMLAGFIAVERRVSEPILPLHLFRNEVFVIACAVGFIVGLAMFGSITFMPLYLQVVKGVSPTMAGFALTPMMTGVLVTSIGSGQIISRIGRYRFFPIAGTRIMTIGLCLLTTFGMNSSVWAVGGYMLVLGLGLGMVMQVLVLAVQNAVEYRDLGVATSGATLFRSIGGSAGVSLFGAIFTATLTASLAARLPAGATLPAATAPAAIRALPASVRGVYLDVFTAALHPVFMYAAAMAALGFVLTWFLKELPLRGLARAETIGASFAMPRDATSLEELERIVAQLEQHEHGWEILQRIAQAAGVRLAPDEIWLLVQLCLASDGLRLATLSERFGIPRKKLDGIAEGSNLKEWSCAFGMSFWRPPAAGGRPSSRWSLRAAPAWRVCWNDGRRRTTRTSERCWIAWRAR